MRHDRRHALLAVMPSFGRFERCGDPFQLLDDRQVLRAAALALAAADALRCTPVRQGQVVVVGLLDRENVVHRLAVGVIEREVVGNGDALRASLHAVAARRAGDGDGIVDDLDGLGHRGAFAGVERPEVAHVARVVEQLLHRRHAAEHHHHPFETRRIADRPRCGRKVGMHGAEEPFGGGWNRRQRTALDGFHHHDGFAVAACHVVAAVRLDAGVVPVEVVDLQLHELRFGVRREDLVEQLRAVVERESETADAPFGLHAGGEGEAAEPFGGAVVRGVEVVQQVVVEVVDAAFRELFVENPLLILLGLEEHRGELRGQREAVAGMPLDERFAHDALRAEVVIHVGRVEIGEAPFEEGVDHPFDLGNVHCREIAGFGQRQPHAAESQFARHGYLRITRLMNAQPPKICSSMPGRPMRKSCTAA